MLSRWEMSKITHFYYQLLSILSEKLAIFTITIGIGKNGLSSSPMVFTYYGFDGFVGNEDDLQLLDLVHICPQESSLNLDKRF